MDDYVKIEKIGEGEKQFQHLICDLVSETALA